MTITHDLIWNRLLGIVLALPIWSLYWNGRWTFTFAPDCTFKWGISEPTYSQNEALRPQNYCCFIYQSGFRMPPFIMQARTLCVWRVFSFRVKLGVGSTLLKLSQLCTKPIKPANLNQIWRILNRYITIRNTQSTYIFMILWSIQLELDSISIGAHP